jgi:hypothetical protein
MRKTSETSDDASHYRDGHTAPKKDLRDALQSFKKRSNSRESVEGEVARKREPNKKSGEFFAATNFLWRALACQGENDNATTKTRND